MSASGQAAEQEPPGSYVAPEKRFARLVRVVTPEFPTAALERGQQGVVDVEGIVQPNGQITKVHFQPDTDASTIFVASLAEMLPYWSFEPALGSNCQPSTRPVLVRVHFEISEGKPHIFATHAKDRYPADPQRSSLAFVDSEYKVIQSPNIAYPKEMIFKNVEANVYAMVTANAEGEITDVQAKAYHNLPYLADPTPRQSEAMERIAATNLAPFETSVIRSLSRWRYVPSASAKPRRMCQSVHFHLKN